MCKIIIVRESTVFLKASLTIPSRESLLQLRVFKTLLLIGGLLSIMGNLEVVTADQNRPNILWLTTEDIGPELGCYGDAMADTPAIDQFAKTALRYKTAWSNYPVCAPARTTIITGAYACSGGAGNMRSEVPLPDTFVMFPTMLREAGYYCTNASKTDYNYIVPGGSNGVWDDSSKKAHYKNRADGQPFFAVFNYKKTHESKIRTRPHDAVIDPASLTLPPFWPDAPEIREDLGQYYDNITVMDKWFQSKLDELKEEGLAENTIVFFYGDHGSGMPRFKRYAGDTGLRVAMLVHIPKALRNETNANFLPGGVSDRLVSFVDLAPTALKLAGIEPHESMVGYPWFEKNLTPSPEFLYGFRERMDERIDLSHCVRDQRYQYTANYLPYLPAGQKLVFQRQTPSTVKWMELFESGATNEVQSRFWKPRRAEEFYDLNNDPWATKNLIDDVDQQVRIERFRAADRAETMRIKDLSFIPEPLVTGLKGGKTSLKQLQEMLPVTFEAAQLASLEFNDPKTDQRVVELLQQGNVAEQAWALVGLRLRKDRLGENAEAIAAAERLAAANSFIAVDAADCLLALGQGDQNKLIDILIANADTRNSNYMIAVRALNALDRHQNLLTAPLRKLIKTFPTDAGDRKRGTSELEKLLTNF